MRKGPPTAVRGTPTSIYSGESKHDSCGGQSRWHHSTCRVKKKKWRIHLFSLHKVRSGWMRDESWSERKFERKKELMQLKFEYVQCFVIVLPNVTQLFSPWNGPMALFIKPSIKQSISTSLGQDHVRVFCQLTPCTSKWWWGGCGWGRDRDWERGLQSERERRRSGGGVGSDTEKEKYHMHLAGVLTIRYTCLQHKRLTIRYTCLQHKRLTIRYTCLQHKRLTIRYTCLQHKRLTMHSMTNEQNCRTYL